MIPIRLANRNDAAQIAAIYSPYCSERSAVSFETVAPGVEEMADRIEKTTERYPWLVYAVGRHILGYAYASPHRQRAAYRWSVETSIYMHPDARRRGAGSTLYSALLEVLRRQGFVNAFAGITLPNPASIALHTAMGFSEVGVFEHVGFKNGQWHDVGWYTLQLRPTVLFPATPRTLSQVSLRGEFAALMAGAPDPKMVDSQADTEENLVLEPKLESELDLDSELALEPESGSELDAEPPVEPDIESELRSDTWPGEEPVAGTPVESDIESELRPDTWTGEEPAPPKPWQMWETQAGDIVVPPPSAKSQPPPGTKSEPKPQPDTKLQPQPESESEPEQEPEPKPWQEWETQAD